MRVLWLLIGVLLLHAPARADDTVHLAPAPAWVVAVEPPAGETEATRGQALSLRLLDFQLRFDETGDHRYLHSVVKVGAPEALSSAGNVMFDWQPETERLTVHRLLVHRGSERIDVLARGQSFAVLRREDRLENAMIDGRLSATLQISDLRVGDMIEIAMTVDASNPVLRGHSENYVALAGEIRADRLHIRKTWPAGKDIRWQSGDGLPEPRLSRSGDDRVFLIDSENFVGPLIPSNAPGRFAELGMIQTGDFASWTGISSLFAPIYDGAATLTADSPVRVEIARIAAASTDPKARAEAALKLVQTDVRYLANMAGLGGYVPETADAVWAARFGDCKGKTALLLAMLRELGIEARAALVSATRGDGLDKSLPMPGRFDHVIVAAEIDGRTYWLDGTRSGDTSLDRIAVPPFEWALPLTSDGAALVALAATPPAQALTENRLDLDARDGVMLPARATGEMLFRGDGAAMTAAGFAFLSEADRDRAIRQYWENRFDWIEIETVSFEHDAAKGEARLRFTGKATMDWDLWGDDAKRRYEADNARLGRDFASERKPGRFDDLPVDIGADHVVSRQTILLPKDGADFFIEGDPIDETIGNARYRRTASIRGGRFEMETATRIEAGEIAFNEAEAFDVASDAVFEKRLFIRVPYNYEFTGAERAMMIEKRDDAGSMPALMRIATADLADSRPNDALAKVDEALEKFGKDARLLAFRAHVYSGLGRADEAEADIDAALAIDPQEPAALFGRANLLATAERYEDALLIADRLVLLQPNSPQAFALRGQLRNTLGKDEQALADFDIVLDLHPDNQQVRIERVRIRSRRNEHDKALADADAYLALFPEDEIGHALRANILGNMDRMDEARAAADRSTAIKPNTDANAVRLLYDLVDGPEERLDLILASIALDPKRVLTAEMIRPALAIDGAYDRILAAYAEAIEKMPSDEFVESARLHLYEAADKHELVLAAMAAKIEESPRTSAPLNSRCWYRATNGIDLDRALADCDAALALREAAPNFDSRGLVHLKRGDFAKSVKDYDAALAINPYMPTSLFGRGVAKLRTGDAGGESDLAAARGFDDDIDEQFAGYGIKP